MNAELVIDTVGERMKKPVEQITPRLIALLLVSTQWLAAPAAAATASPSTGVPPPSSSHSVMQIDSVRKLRSPVDPEALSPSPPAEPQRDEIPFDGKGDKVAKGCADYEVGMAARLHMKIVTVRIAHNPRWGTVWRADTALRTGDHDPVLWWRTICTKTVIEERPFAVFHLATLSRLSSQP